MDKVYYIYTHYKIKYVYWRGVCYPVEWYNDIYTFKDIFNPYTMDFQVRFEIYYISAHCGFAAKAGAN